MYTTHLRKVGGSVMLAVPPAMLESLGLSAGARVGMSLEAGHLTVEPNPRPRYTLEELLSRCDPSLEITDEEREWLDSSPVGNELI